MFPVIYKYIESQFNRLVNMEKHFPDFTRVKFQNENGQSNYMNATPTQMHKIMQVLKERE